MSATPEKSSTRTGLDALLTPQNSVLILIDHQPFQFANVRNIDPTLVLNNTIGLAKGAKAFGVPTNPKRPGVSSKIVPNRLLFITKFTLYCFLSPGQLEKKPSVRQPNPSQLRMQIQIHECLENDGNLYVKA